MDNIVFHINKKIIVDMNGRLQELTEHSELLKSLSW